MLGIQQGYYRVEDICIYIRHIYMLRVLAHAQARATTVRPGRCSVFDTELVLSPFVFTLPSPTHTSIMALTPELEALFFKKFCHSLPYGVYPDEEESDTLVLFVLDEFPVEVRYSGST